MSDGPVALPKPKRFRGELRKHLLLLTADGVKKLITKFRIVTGPSLILLYFNNIN